MNEEYLNFLKSLSYIESFQDRYEKIKEHSERYEKSIEEVDSDFISFIEEILRQKIKIMMSETSLLKQKMLRTQIAEWLRTYIAERKEVDNIINVYAIEEKPVEFFTIGDLLELKSQKGIQQLVKGFIPLGDLFLLVAAPKVGKSLLATGIGLSVARGIPFLNRETVKSKVLYIQNEEQLEKTTVQRIYTHGLQKLELENYEEFKELIESDQMILCRNYDLVLDREKILKLVQDNNIKLVLIDSLGASIRKSGLNELDTGLLPTLYQWQNDCQTFDFTTIILHHSTKSDSTDDKQKMIQGVAGSNTLTRANGGVIRLFPDKHKKDVINLKTIPREGSPLEIDIFLEQDEACYWTWKVEKENNLSPEAIALQNEILVLLYDRYEEWKESLIEEDDFNSSQVYGYNLREIMELTAQPRSVVIARLNDMKNTEGIECTPVKKEKSFIYHIHKSGDSWMRVYLEKERERQDKETQEKLALELYVQGIKNIAKDLRILIKEKDLTEIALLEDSLTQTERLDVIKELLEEEKNDYYLLYFPPEFNVGDIVTILSNGEKGEIVKIKYTFDSKKVSYHNYYIRNLNKPFLKDDLQCKDDVESTS